jgi:hypothetical protein
MIWKYLKVLLFFLLKLVVPPPPAVLIPKIDANARCPVCGHCDGEIRATWETPIILETQQSTEQKVKLGKVYVEHLCHICKARWYTAMLTADAQGKVVANG